MNTQEKIDAGFDVRNIEKIMQEQAKDKRVQKEKRRDYGNKYMEDRKNLNIRKDHIKQLDAIREKIGCRSYDNVIKHLCDVESKVDPAFKTTYRCKTCNEEVKDIPKHINVNKFTHKDLCVDSSCKGFIVTNKEIALDDKGFVISNKDKANGTNESKDKNRAQTDANKGQKKTQKEIDDEEYKRDTAEFERQRKWEMEKKTTDTL